MLEGLSRIFLSISYNLTILPYLQKDTLAQKNHLHHISALQGPHDPNCILFLSKKKILENVMDPLIHDGMDRACIMLDNPLLETMSGSRCGDHEKNTNTINVISADFMDTYNGTVPNGHAHIVKKLVDINHVTVQRTQDDSKLRLLLPRSTPHNHSTQKLDLKRRSAFYIKQITAPPLTCLVVRCCICK
jgi:hypothetical protein